MSDFQQRWLDEYRAARAAPPSFVVSRYRVTRVVLGGRVRYRVEIFGRGLRPAISPLRVWFVGIDVGPCSVSSYACRRFHRPGRRFRGPRGRNPNPPGRAPRRQ